MVRLDHNKVVIYASTTESHREMLAEMFKQEHGVEITRFRHDYDTLDGQHPKLGIVMLMSDSVIDPAYECWVLLGYNAKEIPGWKPPEKTKADLSLP